MPLLWSDLETDQPGGDQPGLSLPTRRARASPPPPTAAASAPSSPERRLRGERRVAAMTAIELRDEVRSEPLIAEELPAPLPLRVGQPPAVGWEPRVLAACAPQLAPAPEGAAPSGGAWEAAGGQAAAGKEALLRLRVEKLAGLRLWPLLGLMRAFRRWALLLDLGAAYSAAAGLAVAELQARGAAVQDSLHASQRRAASLLLAKPSLLSALGGLRAQLQATGGEADAIAQRLAEMEAQAAAAAAALGGVVPLAAAAPRPPLLGARERDAPAPLAPSVQLDSATPPSSRPGSPLGRATRGQRALVAERLAVRLLLAKWRQLRAAAAEQAEALAAGRAQAASLEERLDATSALLREAREDGAAWRDQALVQVNALSEAASAEARATLGHAEEVSCLSEKLRQLVEEQAALQELCAQQAEDLEVLTGEVVRCHGGAREQGGRHEPHHWKASRTMGES